MLNKERERERWFQWEIKLDWESKIPPQKVPEPDGLSANFYQTFKEDLMRILQNIFFQKKWKNRECSPTFKKPSIQFSSVTQSCPTLWNPMNRSTPDLPVHHQLPESTQTHVHPVGDAIQPSHPLLSPSPHALNLSQH